MKQLSARLCLRPYKRTDLCPVTALFYDTVHSVNLADYTEAQANAWAPDKPDQQQWQRLLESEETWVAEIQGIVVGFASRAGDYFDCLYVHKHYQRRRIGTALAEIIERRAAESGQTQLYTHASITARPFFAQRGYVLISRQQVQRRGQYLINFRMKRDI